MSTSKIATYAVLIIILGLALFFGMRKFSTQESQAVKPIQINWLIAHEPAELFDKAARAFADKLKEETGGSMTLKILTPENVGFDGDVPVKNIFEFLEDNSAQISSIFVVSLENSYPPLGVFNLPFLFKNYETAPRILDGSIGKELLESVGKNTSVRALAFTYSGGFRVIASKNKPIKTLEDFKGLRISVSGSPVSEETFRELGASPVSIHFPSVKKNLNAEEIDAIETAYPRLSLALENNTFIRYITETNHSLFLTAIIVDKKFYDSLPKKYQDALRKAASVAAKVEREASIALAKKTKIDAEKQGIIIVQLSRSVSDELKNKLLSVYKKFEGTFGTSTIQGIIDGQNY